MQTIRQPYELLVRWDQDGRISGAHVQYRYVIKDENGVTVGESVTNAEPVSVGSEFPFSDVMTQLHADALAEVMRLKQVIEATPVSEAHQE